MSKEAMKLAIESYCKTLHPLWNTGISRTEAEGFFNAGFKAAEALSKQEQGEPVAEVATTNERQAIITWQGTPLPHGSKLYTTPQQRKPQGYAGIMIWGGDATVTKVFTELQIKMAQDPSELIKRVVQQCLDELSTHGAKDEE